MIRFATAVLITAAAVTYPHAATLQPGTGTWGTDFFNADTVGTAHGNDANAIARWDAVPFRTIDSVFSVGVVAFHINGIARVDFALDAGAVVSVTEMTVNSRTGVAEYWAEIDPALCTDGEIKVLAVAVPNTGVPRILDTLVLYANAGGSLASPEAYVSPSSGDDSNPGTAAAPYRTLQKALRFVGDGGNIYLTEAGVYEIPYYRYGTDSLGSTDVKNNRRITVQPGPGLSRADIVLAAADSGSVNCRVRRLHWKDVTVDFSRISQFYGGNHWFDHIKWMHAEGRAATMGSPTHPYARYYATNSLATDILYGFTGADMVRNCRLEYISGDAFQNSLFIVNSTIDHIDGAELEHHTDISQYFGNNANRPTNVIVYGLRAHHVNATQSIFMGHNSTPGPYVDFAYVNNLYDFDHPADMTPLSQLQFGANDTAAGRITFQSRHVLLWHLTLQQRISLRDYDKWEGDNISVVGCSFQGGSGFNVPGRCEIRDCHFVDTISYGLGMFGTGATGGCDPGFADTSADNFYPADNSPLRNRVTDLVVPFDLNNNPRTGPACTGALEWQDPSPVHTAPDVPSTSALPMTDGTMMDALGRTVTPEHAGTGIYLMYDAGNRRMGKILIVK